LHAGSGSKLFLTLTPRRVISLLLPASTKRTVRLWLKRMRRTCAQRWFSFTPADFLALLQRIGVKPGDVLLIHSSFDRFDGFTGSAMDVILALQKAVSPGGTLLMPTQPFSGSALAYVSRATIFDVDRTPSQVGLLTEVFRRCADVVRSVHPTHPVAAWGAQAAEMIADHHLARTPCGAGTPFGRLLTCDGKILTLGTGMRAMTFYHAVEEILEPEMPFTPFTKEVFSLKSRCRDGTILESTTYLFDRDVSGRRNMQKLIPALKARGAWREGRVGTLPVLLLEAKEVLEACRDLARRGVYCYDHEA
jgi:aminoglycoside 3-N-acetyltransferase